MEMQLSVTTREIEHMANAVHDAYLRTCYTLNWPVKKENQAPYPDLSEDSKQLDRASVRAVLKYLGINEVTE